jgi:hypothetical protein
LSILKIQEQSEAATQRSLGRAKYFAAGFGDVFQCAVFRDNPRALLFRVADLASDRNSFGITAIQERTSLQIVVLEKGMAQLHRGLLSGYAAAFQLLVSVLKIPHPRIPTIPD